MRKIITLTLVASALGVAGLLGASQKVTPKEKQDARIIVSFKSFSENMTQDQVLAYQNYSLSMLKEEVTSNFTVQKRYSTLLNGVVLTVPSSQVYAIRNLSFVDKVDYDHSHHEEYSDGGITVTKAAADGSESENVSAVTMNVPNGTKEGEGILVGILDTGFLINHTHEGKVYTHEAFTALDSGVATKLSKATVDSLTNLNAKPDQGGSLYFNNKVPFYYDYGGLVDTRDDYGEKFNADTDVFSPVSDHGQHVASMAAGNSPSYKGIAPKAQLALFKTATDYVPNSAESKKYAESCGFFDSAVIAALEDAKIIGCDVLNMSFGSDLNDFDSDSIVHDLLADLLENGIWSNYAAGNSGKGYYRGTAYEGWTADMVETGIMSGSANLESVMSVAASQAQKEFYNTAVQINGENISYMDEVNADDNTHLLYDISEEGTKEFNWVRVPNYGEAKDYEGVDVNGKIAIVSRGSNTFEDKVINAQKGKAIALAVINTSNDSVKMSFGNTKPKIPVILLSYDDREKIGDAKSGTLKVLQDVFADNPTADRLASFTSDGATYDLRIKPEIAAPGQNVRGAIYEDKKGNIDPTATDKYAYWSGTSMATPNYTGAVALMLSENISDANYYKTVNARTMSTATQYKDRKGVTASVRIQGAGVANVGRALESKIYLEEFAGSGKAKIQLKNNDDIKAGNIKLSFSATNEGSAAVTFNAHIDIYRPDVYKYEKTDSEIDAVKDVTIQGINNVLLRTVDKTVTIPVGTNTITLDTISLTAEEKKAIDDYFDYACPIEGYVRLENDNATNLSIPFLGYYGDVSAASPVEPFNFEKQEGVLYPSTLLKDVATLVEFPNADYASNIIAGYFKAETWADEDEDEESSSNSTSPLEDWFVNKAAFTNITGDNGYPCFEVGAKKKNDGTYALYSPNGNTANTILIQQYVTRSVKTNELNIIRKSDNKLILEDHMFDTFWGSSGDEETGEEPNYSLAKSHLLSDYLDVGYLAHRAYSIVPLWDNDSKSATYLEPYAEGEYTLEFKYWTTDNVLHVKSYDFVITNAAPEITSVSENGNYIRVRYDSTVGAGSINVTGQINTKVEAEVDEDGYYADLPKAALTKAGKFFFSSGSLSRIAINSVMKYVDGEYIIATSSELTVNHDFKVTKSGSTYTLSFTKNNSATTLTKSLLITIGVPAGYDASQLSIVDTLKDGSTVTRALVGDKFGVTFESEQGVFTVNVNGAKSHSVTAIGANLSKTTYIVGDAFDKAALSVYSIYDNGVTEAYTGEFSYSGFDSTTAGKKQLTVTANGMSTTVAYEVLPAPTVTKIEARVGKLNYEVGEEFDLSTLTVVATYSDGSTKVIENSKVTVTGFDSSTAGSVTITVTYEGVYTTVELTIVEPAPQPARGGCGGEIAATSIILSLVAAAGIALLLISKKKKED